MGPSQFDSPGAKLSARPSKPLVGGDQPRGLDAGFPLRAHGHDPFVALELLDIVDKPLERNVLAPGDMPAGVGPGERMSTTRTLSSPPAPSPCFAVLPDTVQ